MLLEPIAAATLALWLIVAIIAGIIAGIVTGLTPGIHVNLVAAVLVAAAPALAMMTPLLAVCAFIVAMSIAHTFLDTIPSVFLGAPESDKAMGVLPGHRYLLRGNGLMAVKLCVIGGIAGSLLATVLFLPVTWIVAAIYALARSWLAWVLIAFGAFSVWKDAKPLWSFVILALSGTLGLVVLRLPLADPLLPMLSGLFGIATLLYSINENQDIPPQRDERRTELDTAKTWWGGILGIAGGIITSVFPGISAALASALVSRTRRLGDHGFLILLGSLGSAGFILSLAGWLAIEKARNGTTAAIVSLVATTPFTVSVMLGAGLGATGIAAILTVRMGRSAARWLPRLPYRWTCSGVILLVIAIVGVRTGWLGLGVLAVSTAVGLLPAALKTARAQAMGCLLLPTIALVW